MKRISIFHGGELEIDISNFERILQSVITFGDHVWLNANIYPSPSLPKEVQHHMKNVIFELSKRNIVKFWTYPNFNDNIFIPDEILSINDYNELYQAININILENKKLIPLLDISYEEIDTFTLNPESTSKIIELRNEYWNIGISKILGANRLMLGNNPSKFWLKNSEFYRYPQIEQPIIQEIFKNFNITSFSFLDIKDILELYGSSIAFKTNITSISEDILIEFQNDGKIPSNDLLRSYEEFLKYIDEIINSFDTKPFFLSFLKDIGYSISALAFPYISVLPFADSFMSWLYNKKKYGVLTFIVKSRKKTKAIEDLSKKYNPQN